MMVTRLHKLAAISRQLGLRLEGFWLRVLPLLTRDYFWVKVDGLHVYGSIRHQRHLHQLLKGSFEPFTVQLFMQAVKPGMVVLDIAPISVSTLFWPLAGWGFKEKYTPLSVIPEVTDSCCIMSS